MITRNISEELVQSAVEYPVVTVLGPRQSGKTTLVQMTFPGKQYFSLEDPDVRIAADADPRGFLSQMEDGGILDEVQRLPALLSYIQGIVDKDRRPGRFILTGSHQPQLHEAISQSLAGRTAMLTLWPFSLPELRRYKSKWTPFELIVEGCFPRLHEDVLPQFILPAKSRDKIPVKRVGSTILSFPAIGLKKHLIISSQYRPLDNNLCGHGSGNFVRGCA